MLGTRTNRLAVCALALLAGAAFISSVKSAEALILKPQEYKGVSITGPTDGNPASFPNNLTPAIDQQAGVLYVAGFQNSKIFKFDIATRQSVPFSALSGVGASALDWQAIHGCCSDFSVDNSGTSTQGLIYGWLEFEQIGTFQPDGAPTPLPWEINGGQDLCGASVAPDGKYWLRLFSGPITEHDPLVEASPGRIGKATGKLLFPEFSEGCDFEIDSQGYFYVTTSYSGGGFIEKYSPNGQYLYSIGKGGAVKLTIDRSTDDVYLTEGTKIGIYSKDGSLLVEIPSTGGDVAINEITKELYIGNGNKVDVYEPGPPVILPTTNTLSAIPTSTGATLRGSVDPDGVDTQKCYFEWGLSSAYGNEIPCAQGEALSGTAEIPVSAVIGGLTKGTTYHFRLVAENTNGFRLNGADRTFRAHGPPILEGLYASNVKGESARINADIDPDLGVTTYRFEWGPDSGYGNTVPATFQPLGSSTGVQTVGHLLSGLTLDTEYHYRVITISDAGTVVGPDRTFRTFAPFTEISECPNALARQQTGAVLLDHCRAFELVSASNTGGYNVESDLVPGQQPLPGFPRADGRALYGVHNGGIPGTGSPTNKGVDPYLATRGEGGWTTRYVGVPADDTPSTAPFASPLLAAGDGLNVFAFWGSESCDPCFPDGSAGVPVRLSNGDLVQGMTGSIPQTAVTPAGFISKPLSADGSHFVFGSDKKLELAGNEGSVSIYDRNLVTGVTQVVSTLPVSGATMSGDVGELDITTDGARIVVGKGVSVDGAGNRYWDPYMHMGSDPKSVALVPGGVTAGVLYAGMTSDGSDVFYVTKDKIAGSDTDESSDLYLAAVDTGGGVSVSPLTTTNSNACDPAANLDGNNWNAVGGASPDTCGVVAIAGGGGVALSDGSVYFFSPEKLDGSGILNLPNLFVVRPGSGPKFVATFDPDDPVVRNSVKDVEVRRTGEFQVTPGGDYAVFTVVASLTGYDNGGWKQVFRYDASNDAIDCVSCAITRARPAGDATLASNGLSIIDDGRVFFTTTEPLVLRDTGGRRDAYEWTNGDPRLISAGISPFESGLLSASADGRDVYFFTRETLVKGDNNGTLMKLYDARENGGFFVVPDPPPCAASDECHGPGSQAAQPPAIRSLAGTPGGNRPARRCKKGSVRRKGKCVRKPRKPRKPGSHGSRHE